MLRGRRVSSRKREQGKLWAASWRGDVTVGGEIGTDNLQAGRRLELGLLGEERA